MSLSCIVLYMYTLTHYLHFELITYSFVIYKYSVTYLDRIAFGPNFSAGLYRDSDYKGLNSNTCTLSEWDKL